MGGSNERCSMSTKKGTVMKKRTLLFLVTALALTMSVFASSASASAHSWWHHTLHSNVTCNKSNTTPNAADAGPFATKAACLAFQPGGDPGGNPVTVGWPSSNGDPSGTFSCGDGSVTLTSTEDSNGFGAFDFTGPFGTFADLPVFDSSNYTILSGTGAQSEPYLIVRFDDSTEMFLYATDVTGPGTRYSDDVNHNTYLTRAQALASYGDKQVSSITLAVDNGDLSIQANGLSCNLAPITAATFPQIDRDGACASSAVTRVADGSLGTFVDLDQATFDSGTLAGVSFVPSYFVDGIGETCNVPAGYKAAGYNVSNGGTLDDAAPQFNIHPFYVKA